ncbi:MAG: MFS transporter [Anaerolineaceae bacterium]|nr:MFS transporter [Anaerolineaceae bacterium]
MRRLIIRLNSVIKEYPLQFWLLFIGMLISTIGSSMIWPFLMLYVSKTLDIALTQAATLMTINAVMGLIFSFIAGPIIDRVGRKWVMVISLVGNGLMYLLLSHAQSYAEFAVAQGLMGALNPLYRVGADAMMADLIPQEKRAGAYSIMRMSNNTGVAIGPTIGGFVASQSYTLAFYCAAAGLAFYGLLIGLKAKETLPKVETATAKRNLFDGYGQIFRHREFIGFTLGFTLTSMLASMVWTLLSVYTNKNYGIPESLYGFIPTTNAIMVVALQYLVTMVTRRFKSLPVMVVGTVFYAISTALVACFSGFWGFWFCMVVMTIGELIISPTATTYTANLAPTDMRGRYMSIYGLTWSIASGIAPVFGGALNDHLGPRWIWIGGGMIGVISVLVFMYLSHQYSRNEVVPGIESKKPLSL